MTYRKIDTCIWKDPWFETLTPHEKLAFFYFWTNDHCNQAGIYEISKKRIEFDLGYGVDMVSDRLEKKIIWYESESTVWVKNFFRHQCQNQSFAVAAVNAVKKDAFKYQIFIDYNLMLLERFKVNLNGHGADMVSA